MEMYLEDFNIRDKNLETCQIHCKRKLYKNIISILYIFSFIKGVKIWWIDLSLGKFIFLIPLWGVDDVLSNFSMDDTSWILGADSYA